MRRRRAHAALFIVAALGTGFALVDGCSATKDPNTFTTGTGGATGEGGAMGSGTGVTTTAANSAFTLVVVPARMATVVEYSPSK